MKKYIKKTQEGVGQAKGGWVDSLLTLGGNCAGWISRHRRAGTCIDNLKKDCDPLRFTMINRSKWARGGDEDRIVDKVMENRAAMIKKDIEFLLANNWKRNARGRAM